MATFTHYAVGASMLAMADARWDPQSLTDQQRDMAGVCLGSGIGNLEEMYASAVEYDKGVCAPYRTSRSCEPRG